MWDDYSQLSATRLVCYLSSHIQRALVESLLNIRILGIALQLAWNLGLYGESFHMQMT